MTTKEAMDHLIKELKTDEAYRYSWLANIAVAFQDEWQRSVQDCGLPCTREHIHKISNTAADNFLNLLCMDNGSERQAIDPYGDEIIKEHFQPTSDLVTPEPPPIPPNPEVTQ